MNGKKIVMAQISTLLALALVCVAPICASADNKLIVKGADGTTNNFTVDDTGAVSAMGRAGFGTNAPSAGIHVKGSAFPNNCVMAEGNDISQGAGYLGYMVRPNNTFPLLNDRLGFLLFGTLVNNVGYHAAGFAAFTDGDWTPVSTPAYFSFLTTATGQSSRSERLKISSAGNTQIFGGIQMSKNAGSPVKPTCSAAARGTIWYAEGATGTADVVNICIKDASENYNWKILPVQ